MISKWVTFHGLEVWLDLAGVQHMAVMVYGLGGIDRFSRVSGHESPFGGMLEAAVDDGMQVLNTPVAEPFREFVD